MAAHRTDGMTHLAIFGIPGSGKTTLAKRLVERLGWSYVSTGDIARAVDPVTATTGAMADEDAFRAAFASIVSQIQGPTVFDGIPRSEGQVALLPQGTLCILLTCRLDIAQDRLARRGRTDDGLAKARIDEQLALLDLDNADSWAWRTAGRECALSTSRKSPDIIERDVVAFLNKQQREVY